MQIQKVHLITWCGNHVKTRNFRRVLSDSHTRLNFGILHSVFWINEVSSLNVSHLQLFFSEKKSRTFSLTTHCGCIKNSCLKDSLCLQLQDLFLHKNFFKQTFSRIVEQKNIKKVFKQICWIGSCFVKSWQRYYEVSFGIFFWKRTRKTTKKANIKRKQNLISELEVSWDFRRRSKWKRT